MLKNKLKFAKKLAMLIVMSAISLEATANYHQVLAGPAFSTCCAFKIRDWGLSDVELIQQTEAAAEQGKKICISVREAIRHDKFMFAVWLLGNDLHTDKDVMNNEEYTSLLAGYRLGNMLGKMIAKHW